MEYISKSSPLFRPRALANTMAAERSRYLNDKINAAAGLCPEPRHPLDSGPPEKRKRGASHGYKLGFITRKDYIR
jgi:hypothetical protein